MRPTDLLRPLLGGWNVPLLIFAVGYMILGMPRLNNELNDGCSLLTSTHFILYSKRVVTSKGVYPAAVEVKDGRIVSVIKRLQAPKGVQTDTEVLDFQNAVIMPGLIDIHVHLDEPGRTEWEGFETGTMAAAAGGITTLVDMPLNSHPATTTKEHLQLKKEAARGKIFVDVGFWGGLVPENAGNLTILDELLSAGVLGLKSFMCPSGINDFPMTTASDIQAALPLLAKYGRPILVHAEVVQPPLVGDGVEEKRSGVERLYSTYLGTRPSSWEQEAVRQLVDIAKATVPGGPAEGAHVHIVHLSDAGDSLNYIKEAKKEGLAVSVETCPHYLAFAAEEIGDGDTRYKCAPPIRNAFNRENLWRALKVNRRLNRLVKLRSLPSPTRDEIAGEGRFLKAWGGISSLQFMLPITWTTGKLHGIDYEQIAQWWSSNPARLANLDNKGSIQFGKDADLVVWDPEQSFTIDENFTVYHRHKVTPYAGWTLSGTVISTFVRGQQIYKSGEFASMRCGMKLSAL